MGRIIRLNTDIRIVSRAAIGGYEERRGPLGADFDFCDLTDSFGQSTWESAESEMGRLALNTALSKLGISHTELDLLVAGDLQNQCAGTTFGLGSFGIPFLGIYGACSTCTEALLILSSMMDSHPDIHYGAAVTSSHNSAAERQFRTPLEYGAQRPPTAQWTATAAGAFLLARGERGVRISEIMPGRIVDSGSSDGANMGAAMSFAAFDTITAYFKESGIRPSEVDYIVTGDLGRVGSDILKDLLSREIPGAERYHIDCGMLLYDSASQDAHAGASGCGTSASVLATHFLPMLEDGRLRNILFLSTGALMNPQTLLQGQSISGIAPLIRLSHSD